MTKLYNLSSALTLAYHLLTHTLFIGEAYTFLTQQEGKHAGPLMKLMREADQVIPPALEELGAHSGPTRSRYGGGGGRGGYGGGRGGGGYGKQASFTIRLLSIMLFFLLTIALLLFISVILSSPVLAGPDVYLLLLNDERYKWFPQTEKSAVSTEKHLARYVASELQCL